MTVPDATPLRLETPDRTFRFTAADRAAVVPHFDADALERLLQQVRPDMRGEILSYFQMGQGARGHLVEIADPQLQSILEEVWAPFWEDASDQDLEENSYQMPGREIAMARRAAARERAQQLPKP